MKLDFNKIIEGRKEVLELRKSYLNEIKSNLKISEPVEFIVSDIDQNNNPRKKGEKVGHPLLNFLENVKGSVVYIFEIADPKIKMELLNKIATYRLEDRLDENGNKLKRSISKLPLGVNKNESNVLYVGSVQENIHSRIRQHFGLGHPKTFSLQLKHWSLPNWKFKFYFIEISNKEVTLDIEAAISKEFNPLIGKREK